jgi:hypothetical protein
LLRPLVPSRAFFFPPHPFAHRSRHRPRTVRRFLSEILVDIGRPGSLAGSGKGVESELWLWLGGATESTGSYDCLRWNSNVNISGYLGFATGDVIRMRTA